MNFFLEHWFNIVSLFLAIVGVLAGFRKVGQSNSISFYLDQAFALVDDFVSKKSNLEISFKGNSLDHGVVLMTGYLVNDGVDDISKDHISEPLTCRLPGDCKFLEVEILGCAPSLKVNSRISADNETTFDFDLFKKGESFSFQALVLLDKSKEASNSRDIFNQMQWSHRIASLKQVKNREYPQFKRKSKKWAWLARIIGGSAGITYIALGVAAMLSVGPMAIKPVVKFTDSQNAIYELNPKSDGKIEIVNLNNNEKSLVILDDYLKENHLTPTLIENKNNKYGYYINLSVLFLGGLLMLYLSFERDYKIYRTDKLIEASKLQVRKNKTP